MCDSTQKSLFSFPSFASEASSSSMRSPLANSPGIWFMNKKNILERNQDSQECNRHGIQLRLLKYRKAFQFSLENLIELEIFVFCLRGLTFRVPRSRGFGPHMQQALLLRWTWPRGPRNTTNKPTRNRDCSLHFWRSQLQCFSCQSSFRNLIRALYPQVLTDKKLIKINKKR